MSRTTKTMLTLGISVLLLSAMTMAQAAAKNSAKDPGKDTQQHSRLSKVAFWRHHNDASKNAKPAKTTASSKQAKPTTAQVKPVSAKQVSGKPVTANKDQKSQSHAGAASKPATKSATKTAPVAKKAKTEPAQGPDKPPLKQ
jgi:hypothetical protein